MDCVFGAGRVSDRLIICQRVGLYAHDRLQSADCKTFGHKGDGGGRFFIRDLPERGQAGI
ncbi:hypothetical protein HOE425_310163 [Hoeflea sp. EC-HK425]|nr:hypothetical protein HOE425_310163 [Hoeflea sp. EC-HK425]